MNMTAKNEKLKSWIKEVADMCQPDSIYWCNGTKEEYDQMMAKMIAAGSATVLRKRSGQFSFPFRSERCSPRRGPHIYQYFIKR